MLAGYGAGEYSGFLTCRRLNHYLKLRNGKCKISSSIVRLRRGRYPTVECKGIEKGEMERMKSRWSDSEIKILGELGRSTIVLPDNITLLVMNLSGQLIAL